MNEDELKSLIATILRVPESQVSRDASFLCDLGADSLALAELLGMIERKADKQLLIDELQEVETVGDLEDLLNGR